MKSKVTKKIFFSKENVDFLHSFFSFLAEKSKEHRKFIAGSSTIADGRWGGIASLHGISLYLAGALKTRKIFPGDMGKVQQCPKFSSFLHPKFSFCTPIHDLLHCKS
ncbi:hypothetical protein [Prevotella rectalis]|uniref:hypothetical protein n=1 Tax=Prevotella rectalis TaxID=2219999 RepID=UPI001031B004|nr:hypothetical protein [Prevotella brunnea]